MTCYVYFLTNKWNNVLYVGMTNNLERRVFEHKSHMNKSFTQRYNCDRLVYYEEYPTAMQAIEREKFIKKRLSRKMKNDLVDAFNPEWRDLSDDWGITPAG